MSLSTIADESTTAGVRVVPATAPSLESNQSLGDSLSDPVSRQIPLDQQYTPPVSSQKRTSASRSRIIGLALLIIGLGLGAFIVVRTAHGNKHQSVQASLTNARTGLKVQSIPLSAITQQLNTTSPSQASSLTINGQMTVGGALVVKPSPQPSNAVAGQIYYNQTAHRLAYYNGSGFITLQGGGNTSVTNNVSNITNNTSITNNISSDGLNVLGGTPGDIAMFISGGGIDDSLLAQAGSTITATGSINVAGGQYEVGGTQIASSNLADSSNLAKLSANQTFSGSNSFATGTNSATAFQVQNASNVNLLAVDTLDNTVNVGATGTNPLSTTVSIADSSAAPQTVTLGSADASSATTIQGGTGNLMLATGSVTGTSGSVTIQSGSSSTTAAGNVTIDSGNGFISGTQIEDKTFEDGTDNMISWFGGDTVAQSNAQAHTGVDSLSETGQSSGSWGVIEDVNGPIVSAIPGHHYFFTAWIRAATTPETIHTTIQWYGSDLSLTLPNVQDNTTGWTEVSGSGVAPAGTTNIFWEFNGVESNNEVHYFDDLTITDLSSSSATSELDLGATNAQIVTLGNANEVGTTSIFGGSGINLNSGAASLNVTAGAATIAAQASSSFSTSAGSLTLTSATAATWGISTASSGDGQDLTLQAGNGAAGGSNNGGNLILQGGGASGGGTGGEVVVLPKTDSITAFMIQNAAGTTTVLSADTLNDVITVSALVDQGSLTVDGHIVSGGGSPGITAGTAACTSPTISLSGTDTSGTITVITGSACASSGALANITFANAFGAAPHVTLTPGSSSALALGVYVDDSTISTAGFAIGTNTTPSNTTTYKWNYQIIQ